MQKATLKFLSLLLLCSACLSSFANEKPDEEFLPAYEVRLSDQARTSVHLGAGALAIIGVSFYLARFWGNIDNVNWQMVSGHLGATGGSAASVGAITYLGMAATNGFTEDNLKDLKRDYKYLIRYHRTASRSGELSWHEGINQVYGKFLCESMGRRERVRYVSDILRRLDELAVEMASLGEDSIENVADAVASFSFGHCSSRASETAAVGILSAGIYYHL